MESGFNLNTKEELLEKFLQKVFTPNKNHAAKPDEDVVQP